jgi:glyoxylase-like metal-dependent hydrolase (beta-lactamase superfamily II)
MESDRRNLLLAALAAPAMIGLAAAVPADDPRDKRDAPKDAKTQKDTHEVKPPWDPAMVNLASKEMAGGVFAVMPDDVLAKDHVATTGGFIVGDRNVLVVEAMLNGDLASQHIGLVRKETPKAIRFLVNTSYHGDHAYGNYVFPDSTVVIQHPVTKRYMDEKFEDDRRFMLGLMGKGKGIERVQSRSADITVSDTIRVDLGGRAVEIRHFGFAQTPGDLVIWTPDAKVLWVGNMIQAPAPALPWLLEGRHRDTIETLTKVRDFLPKDATIIPGHGRPMRPADIDFPIQYLRELDSAVGAAIAEGRSLEATLKLVRMPQYSKYSLFDWVHYTVNVPAVYHAIQQPSK